MARITFSLAPDKGEVVGVAQQGGVLEEGQGHELLHQEVEKKGAEDATLRRPVLQLLEFDPGAAMA